MTHDIIGVDIAKDWIDSHILSDGRSRRVPCRPAALAEAGVPFARVNPRQAREFARATGRLAKPVPGPIGEPTASMPPCWPKWAGPCG